MKKKDLKIGKKYKIIEHCCDEFHKLGDILICTRDDDSECPEFLNTRTNEEVFLYASFLKPFPTKLKLIKFIEQNLK